MDQWDWFRRIYLNIYLKRGDKLRIERAEVERIEYGFWKGKFCEVTITTNGFKNWASLKKDVLSKFGEGKAGKLLDPGLEGLEEKGFREEGFGEIEWHIWLGKITEMSLLYFGYSEIGKFWMGSTVLREQAFKQVGEEQRGEKK